MGPKIIIAGAPASGKGTQCEYIKSEYGCIHLSTGDMLRAAVAAGSDVGKEAKGYMESGGLVPDKVIIDIIVARLAEKDCMEKGWLLDGFPRTRAQADALIEAGLSCDVFINLDVPDEVLLERVTGRRADPETGTIYHMKFKPPPTDEIAARLTQRADDTVEALTPRLENFHKNVQSIIDVYSDSLLYVNGNRSPALVWATLRAKIPRFVKKQVIFVMGGPGSDRNKVAKALASENDYTFLSMGELLSKSTTNSGLITGAIESGELVNTDIAIEVLTAALNSAECGKKVILDGFPRTQACLQAWAAYCSATAFFDYAIYVDTSVEKMKGTLTERANAGNGKSCDKVDLVNKRLSGFLTSTIPVFDLLSRAGKLRVLSGGSGDGAIPFSVTVARANRYVRAASLLPPYERTFAMIKPDAVSHGDVPKILERIKEINLSPIFIKLVQMDEKTAGAFYAEHKDRPFFPRLKQFMTSGPVIILVLEGSDAIRAWRTLMGPTNTQVAEKEAPDSLRALYGTDGTQNATHGSDSPQSAIREIDFWTNPASPGGALPEATLPSATDVEAIKEAQADVDPDEAALMADGEEGGSDESKMSPEDEMRIKLSKVASTIPIHTPLSVQDTFAMIKPLISEANYMEIMDIIAAHGFEVVSEMKVTLSTAQAQEFYTEHEGKPFYDALVAYMTSGPVVALHLRREYAIGAWRHLIGPTNLGVCQSTRPDSIRAKFALDGTRNACHGSDSPASAARELSFMFTIGGIPPTLLLDSTKVAEESGNNSGATVVTSHSVPPNFVVPKRYAQKVKSIPTINSADIALMDKYANNDLEPIMKELLQKLMINRPEDITGTALTYLAEIHQRAGKQLPAFSTSDGTMDTLNPVSPRTAASDSNTSDKPLPAIGSS